MSESIKCNVQIDRYEIVDNKYAVYHIVVKVIRSDRSRSTCEYISKRRFSEFLKLKKSLETEFQTEVPYDLPSKKFFLGQVSNSCDPEVVEERRKKLQLFLDDLLNDSFDPRWKNSNLISEFLNMPQVWNRPPTFTDNDEKALSSDIDGLSNLAKNPASWLELFRNAKLDLKGTELRSILRGRLIIGELEKGLKFMKENELLSKIECERRKQLLISFRETLDEANFKSGHERKHELDMITNPSSSLTYTSKQQSEQPRIVGGRKLGETSETKNLSDEQLFQRQKTMVNEQDQEVLALYNVVQRQKNISLILNEELAAQNEILDMFEQETNASKNKLLMASKAASRFNDSNHR